jgi:hypothetical protein
MKMRVSSRGRLEAAASRSVKLRAYFIGQRFRPRIKQRQSGQNEEFSRLTGAKIPISVAEKRRPQKRPPSIGFTDFCV